jgi:hypothetical protein
VKAEEAGQREKFPKEESVFSSCTSHFFQEEEGQGSRFVPLLQQARPLETKLSGVPQVLTLEKGSSKARLMQLLKLFSSLKPTCSLDE